MRLVVLYLLVSLSAATAGVAAEPAPRLMAPRPSAIVFDRDHNQLLVSDASHGRVILVHLHRPTEPTEFTIGDSLVDLAKLADDRLIAIDRKLRQLICFRIEGQDTDAARISEREGLDLDPARMALSDAGAIVCVTSRWSRAVQLVHLSEASRSKTTPPLDVGFECHEILPLPDQRFLVADAFGGKLAVIDAGKQRVEAKQTIHGHNIRGLAVTEDGSGILISHQILSRVVRSDFDDIHWGSLMQNVVSRVPIAMLTRSPAEFRKSVQCVPLGDTGRGFADPTGIVALADGFAVLSGGARQLSIFKNGERTSLFDVGRRPTRLLRLSEDRLAVVNEHDGTLSVVSTTGGAKPDTVRLSTNPSPPVSTGEAAFYDASLSHDSWMTCNSCHVDAHTPGLLADTFGDRSFGAAKLIPSLFARRQLGPTAGWATNLISRSRSPRR